MNLDKARFELGIGLIIGHWSTAKQIWALHRKPYIIHAKHRNKLHCHDQLRRIFGAPCYSCYSSGSEKTTTLAKLVVFLNPLECELSFLATF